MEPTLQGFIDFHGETIKSQYDLYIESLKPREDDIDTITDNLINNGIQFDKNIELVVCGSSSEIFVSLMIFYYLYLSF